jgi:hypothetical protein
MLDIRDIELFLGASDENSRIKIWSLNKFTCQRTSLPVLAFLFSIVDANIMQYKMMENRSGYHSMCFAMGRLEVIHKKQTLTAGSVLRQVFMTMHGVVFLHGSWKYMYLPHTVANITGIFLYILRYYSTLRP